MADELPMPDPPLANAIVALRAWSESDIPFIVAACNDPLFERFTAAIPSPYGEADARAWLASHEPARRAGRSLELAILDASSAEPLGAVALSNVDARHRRSEMGYWLAERARGRGIATEAVRLLAGWALRVLRLERLTLMIHPENAASQRVAERCGFTREGLLRSHMLKQGSGERRDALLYGLLPHEFRSRDT
jgi:[ribosomal protein S5]-alanine N-acetyltransferase